MLNIVSIIGGGAHHWFGTLHVLPRPFVLGSGFPLPEILSLDPINTLNPIIQPPSQSKPMHCGRHHLLQCIGRRKQPDWRGSQDATGSDSNTGVLLLLPLSMHVERCSHMFHMVNESTINRAR
jgi:hypothetical protein